MTLTDLRIVFWPRSVRRRAAFPSATAADALPCVASAEAGDVRLRIAYAHIMDRDDSRPTAGIVPDLGFRKPPGRESSDSDFINERMAR